MPNVLGDRFDDAPATAVLDLATQVIRTEAARVAARLAAHRSAQFDGLRSDALGTVSTVADFSPEARAALVTVSGAILTSPAGRSWFTLGLLKDVVLEIALADRTYDAELVALGHAVADKLVHQVRGTHADVEDLRQACASLPNADEIDRLIDRMMDGPSDELLPLL